MALFIVSFFRQANAWSEEQPAADLKIVPASGTFADSESLNDAPLVMTTPTGIQVEDMLEEERRSSPSSRRGGSPFGGARMRRPGYSATWYPSTSVDDQQTDFGLVRQLFTMGAPIWRQDGDIVILRTTVENSLFSTDAILPDTGRAFPDELWTVNVGLNYIHQFDNGWSGGLMTTVGSASDKPFHSIDEVRASVLGFLQVPASNDRDTWQYSVMYAPFSDLNFPIPGVAYGWNPSETFQMNIGIPFSVTWKPLDALAFNASYFPLYNVNALVTYDWTDDLQFYGGFETIRETFLLTNRASRSDQFLASEQRVIGGLRWNVWKYAALDVNAGYAFGRYYGEGGNRRDELYDLIDIAPGPFLGSSLIVRF
ncbi:hypothetical protein [Symmachiella dynata]|uniref:hypothetical protein n=1 Tax=Symmachiella dynata TaxID=2527995 RepID=UPI0030ECB958